ncbi:MAG: hypothetical protein JW748_02040, partial [Anaerolineales bacterium]|nr:hypothetical protein [Anaerolineales bacterium]
GYAAYGAYGLGENLGAGMSGITVSAIFNATGKRVPDYPTTPDKVLGKIWRTHILQAYLPRLSPRSIMKRNFSNCGTALNPSDPRCRAMNTLLTMGAFQPKIGAIPMDFRRTGIYRQGMDSFFFFRHDKSGPGQFC